MAITQVTRGILVGCKLVTIQKLNNDGSLPSPIPDIVKLRDITKIPIETTIEQGQKVVNRADGVGVISVDEEDDTLIGVSFDLVFNSLDFNLISMVLGGTLQMDDTNTIINGIVLPTITQQRNSPKRFQVDIYIPSYNIGSNFEGYVRYRFPYCRGMIKGLTHGTTDLAQPTLNIKAGSHPSTEQIQEIGFTTILP